MSEHPPPGALVAGKYRLTRLLGRGGMGAVWEGQHVTLGTRVAVKFIDAEYAASPEARSRFENEARAAAALRSKHVVQVHDHGVDEEGRAYIVMEYLEGEPLDRRLERLGTLPLREVAILVAQVCRGLAKAHELGIVHRDLKPENVFLVLDEDDGTDVVKVVDFGIAKFTEGGTVMTESTRTGAVLGTPCYMSPEQARGLRTVDLRTDLWSVGVIAFRCVVGKLPFEGVAMGDLLVKICTTAPPVPSTLRADLPPGFDEWFAKALAQRPEERFQSAGELAEALLVVAGISGSALPSLTPSERGAGAAVAASSAPLRQQPTHAPTTQPIPGLRRRSGVSALLLALVVVGLGGGAALLWAAPASRTSEPTEPSSAAAASSRGSRPPDPGPVITPSQEPSGGVEVERPATAAQGASATAPPSASTVAPSPPRTLPASKAPRPPRQGRPGPRGDIDVGY